MEIEEVDFSDEEGGGAGLVVVGSRTGWVVVGETLEGRSDEEMLELEVVVELNSVADSDDGSGSASSGPLGSRMSVGKGPGSD